MVIILLILGCLCLFASAMFINGKTSRIIGILIGIIVMVGSTTLMVLNYHSHFGMTKVTTTKTRQVQPVSSQLPIALYQPIGTSGKEEVLMYRNSAKGKVQHTKADETISSQVKFANVDQLTMTTKTTTWQFKNHHYRTLFMWSGINGTVINKKITITYPQEYVKVTPKQMKKLRAVMATSSTATARAAQKQALDAAVNAALAKHPNATPKQKTAIAQQVQRQAAAQMLQKALASIK